MWSPSYTETPSLFIKEMIISDDYYVFLFDNVSTSSFLLYTPSLFENNFVTTLSSILSWGPFFNLILPI